MEKRIPLTKDQIVSTAIALADNGGINALSMRKLAGKLSIKAMSLYHHFHTKEELICAMADKLLSQIEFSPDEEKTPSDWRIVMQKRASSAMALFREHPWLPFVIDSQMQSGEKRLEYLNSYLGTLREAGFPIDLTLRVTSLIDSYIYGYCRQLSHISNPEKAPEDLAADFSHTFTPDLYPYLSEATSLFMEQGYDEQADFLFGLNVILDGVALVLKTLDR